MKMEFRFFHFAGWFLVYFLVIQFAGDIVNQFFDQEKWLWDSNPGVLISGYLVFFLDALLVYFVLYRYYARIGVLGSTLVILSLFPVMIAFRYFIQEIFCPMIGLEHNYFEGVSLSYYFIDNIYFTTIYTSFAALYFLIRLHEFREKQSQLLTEQNKRSELDFLKSQINPHFLFNNLNSIYSLVYSKSDKAIPAMDKLTELLRYGLYEKEALVSLEKEVEYMENYIGLQRLRYDYDLLIERRIDIQDLNVMIPPLMLIPFVENAFKHGVFKEGNFLEIILEVKEGKLNFSVSNPISDKEKDQSGGIGLENVKRRLELIYGEHHGLSIKTSEGKFHVHLKIEY